MSTPELDVSYVAKLARINLSSEEVARFQEQLSQVLVYVEQLGKLDLTDVEPTAHTSEVMNVFREDESRAGLGAETALQNAPHRANGLFGVTKVLD